MVRYVVEIKAGLKSDVGKWHSAVRNSSKVKNMKTKDYEVSKYNEHSRAHRDHRGVKNRMSGIHRKDEKQLQKACWEGNSGTKWMKQVLKYQTR